MKGNASLLQAVRERFKELPAPIVIFNKSHSGSRLLSDLIKAGGIFIGSHCNESNDSLDLLRLVEYLVCKYYPDFGPLWNDVGSRDEHLAVLIEEVFAAHLKDAAPGARWGWKLCETAYILPVVDFLFPRAKYLHLLRDGRDVAFCDHTPPDTLFWKKIYFNTDRIATAGRLRLDQRDYRRRSHIYNARHWVNSVVVGRTYGAMLRERYMEVRYENLCQHFEVTARGVLGFIGASQVEASINLIQPQAHRQSIGKYKSRPRSKIRQVIEIEKPLLLSLGYLTTDPFQVPSRSWRRRIKAMFRTKVQVGE